MQPQAAFNKQDPDKQVTACVASPRYTFHVQGFP